MTERPSYWTSRLGATLILALAVATGAAAQDELAGVCVGVVNAPGECFLATGTARIIQPRIGLALWGGSPVPGTASTVGLRLRGSPRIAVSGRVSLVPTTLPPLPDRSGASATGLVGAGSIQTTIGLFHGYSPLPTVGGFLSLDGILRGSLAWLPTGKGLRDGSVLGMSAGLRLGVLRESLTLPGISVTATYGRSGTVTYGDPEGSTDGAIQGAVSGLHATVAASKRVLGLRMGGGLSYDRYTSDVRVLYSALPLGIPVSARAEAVLHRWSAFGSLTWSHLIYHGVLELGLQESPTPGGLPADVTVEPVGWWISGTIRFTP